MAQELEQPIWLPKLISIEDFIAEQSGLQLADNLSLQFKLFEVYRAYPIRGSGHLGSILKVESNLALRFQ